MKGIKSVFIEMQRVNTIIISLALLAMIGVIFLQTFCRFVIFRSLSWFEELSRYLFVTLIVLGVNLAITNYLSVRIEIIDNYLKGTAAVMMNLIRKLIMIHVSVMFIYSSFELILTGAYQTGLAMRIPMSFLYDIVFIGFTMNVFASLIDLYETHVRAPEEEAKQWIRQLLH